MKEYCIDSNILFSALISRKEKYLQIFSSAKFYTPDFALIEIDKYAKVILKKTKTDPSRLEQFTLLMFSLLTIVPKLVISAESIQEAFDICREVDEKDTMYVALAIQLNIAFITRDKALF
jgi:predicted nucleic acid-binding protein